MASQSRKYRGFATERIVAQYLQQWWEFASVGRGKGKDIYGVPNLDIEVKARTGFQPKQVLAQIKARTSLSGEMGFAVLRLNGQGEDAREYAAIIRFEDLVTLLVKAGYPQFKQNVRELDIERCNKCGAYQFKDINCTTCFPPVSRITNANI
jgi:hypothetical protein